MSAPLLTAEQLSRHLQVSIETIWRYTRQGKLPALKIGNHYRYSLDQAMRALSDTADSFVPGQCLSYEQFSQLPEQPGLQLIDGVLIKEPSPRFRHQDCVGFLNIQVRTYAASHGLGTVIVSPFDVILADDQVLQPDVMFVSNEHVQRIAEHGILGAPDLVVEVLSPATRMYDLGRKKELYLQYGTTELWIIDLEKERLIFHTEVNGESKDTSLGYGDVLTSKVSPGFTLDLSLILKPDKPER